MLGMLFAFAEAFEQESGGIEWLEEELRRSLRPHRFTVIATAARSGHTSSRDFREPLCRRPILFPGKNMTFTASLHKLEFHRLSPVRQPQIAMPLRTVSAAVGHFVRERSHASQGRGGGISILSQKFLLGGAIPSGPKASTIPEPEADAISETE